MSLTEVRLMDVVKKQYAYKLKAYIQVYFTLIFLQVLAILFSLFGLGGAGISSSSINMDIKFFSADLVLGFTMIWGFITASLITTKAYRYDDFAFVTNRLSANLSNVIFLLTSCAVGGVLAVLSTYIMKIILFYFMGNTFLENLNARMGFTELLMGTLAAILYVFMLSALGYLVGTLIQISKLFIVVLPAAVFGGLFWAEASGNGDLVGRLFSFIFTEPSFLIFCVKMIVMAGLLFTCSFILTNRMEVKS